MKSRAREEELLQAAESGDVNRLRTLVLGRDLNFESTDQLGRTPLHLAVVNDHKEVSRRVPLSIHSIAYPAAASLPVGNYTGISTLQSE